jgi:SAM-dependent methyltransferase
MSTATERLSASDIDSLDPYVFFALLGKRVIHPGGRPSTDQLIRMGGFAPGQKVLDVGCGVATTAIELAKRHRAKVTAVDISPLMLERATNNVRRAGLGAEVTVEKGDILQLRYREGSFDRVVAEAVTMFVDRSAAARELVRVCRPGGMVLATEFLWRSQPSEAAEDAFLVQVCPGMQFDDLASWKRIYEGAGLADVRVISGPFELMTAKGFLHDEGIAGSAGFVARTLSRPAYVRKMAWIYPRVKKAVPYLGYIVVAGTKPS